TLSVANDYPFVDADVPGKVVNISYTEETIEKTASFNISVYATAEYELVTEAPADWSGNYLMVASYTDGEEVSHTVAMNSALTNFDNPLNFKDITVDGTKATAGQECEFTVAAYSSGYSMQGKNGKYAYGDGNNRFMTSAEPKALTFAYTSGEDKGSSITATAGMTMRFNTSTAGGERFGFYTGEFYVKLYKLVESDNADAFAQLFLETLSTGASAVCQYDESTHTVSTDVAALKSAWISLAGDYSSLTQPEKEQFRTGSPSETGTNIQKALALYVHIATVYGHQLDSTDGADDFDFMGRNIVPLASSQSGLVEIDSTNVPFVLVIISLVSVTAIAGCIILRKKRHY
ncbi:MAG: hypothetical protein K6C32_03635, partial [Bacilli bacterium]|nr:hypothetical protein [Bacilli bacterium]